MEGRHTHWLAEEDLVPYRSPANAMNTSELARMYTFVNYGIIAISPSSDAVLPIACKLSKF